ncbi:fdxN element excision controlling factor protein [Crocosphaera watsonii]|uniref:FdxN element excision controlling factor protein n=1 Tax=Crocosphaera watsonii WH 0003 TaxID=423471 RepID=G5J0P8_CROWT|nr:fdxN element excision controlling factor protein [Crocosphaera watsonii]EHJ14220.1 fdxN element excision controlling factor protein [Crocosphaera watsonii WH 0003]
MPARDVFHDAVIHALEREEWQITHDPYLIYYELGKMYILAITFQNQFRSLKKQYK